MATDAGSRRAGASGAAGAGIDPIGLAAFRILLGSLLLVAVIRYFAHGWIAAQFIEPRRFFPYEGLEWIRPWPGHGMYVHFGVLAALAILFALGLFYRAAALLLALGFTHVHLIDKTNYLNHYYLLGLLLGLAVFLPLHRVGSLDSLRKRWDARQALPRWPLLLLRFQVGVVYFWAGVAKLQGDWLLRAEPLRTWLRSAGDTPIIGPLLAWPPAAVSGSWAAAAIDLSLPFLLLWRRTRSVTLVAAIAFHVVSGWLLPIGLFPLYMIVALTVFLQPSWPRLLPWIGARLGPGPTRTAPVAAGPGPAGRAAIAAHVALQLLLPLRHWLHPGDVLWTEEGFRWSWRVMLVEKVGRAVFTIHDPGTGATWDVHPEALLTPVQARMLSTQPDMILQLAHQLARELESQGRPGCEVRADVRVSLNGRPSSPLVDRHVDLAREPGGWTHQRWILPAPR